VTAPETAPHTAASAVTAPISASDVAVGDLAFRLYLTGPADPSAETVLFLHGSGPGATGRSNWEAIIAGLGGQFRCLAPDMIGFGYTDFVEGGIQGMGPFNELRATALLGLLDVLEIEKVHLVGNSMGGKLAIIMALTAPERIGKIILMGSGGAPGMPVSPGLAHLREFYADPSEESLRGLLTQFVYDTAVLADKVEQVAKERMSYVRRDDVRRSHAASFDPDGPRRFFTREELSNVDHHVLAIHGRDDRIIPVAASRYFADSLPNAELYIFGKCGHWTQIEHAARFNRLVIDHFSEAGDPPSEAA
jgi:2-hydroxymuconate-semialdehyde hydrolase